MKHLLSTTLIIKLLAAFSVLSMTPAAHAQDANWPKQTIKMVVPYAPGGPTDIIARLLSTKVGAELGQSVIVDNKAGAGGTIGVAQVLKSAPDGYTFSLVAPGPISGMPNLTKLSYTPQDILYVTLVAKTSAVIAVQADSGIKTLADLIREAKAKPGKLNYGSAGHGTTTHLGVELLKQESGIDMVHVAYKGAAPALTALLAGEVQMVMLDMLPTLPHVASGKLKVLAIVGESRVPQMPDVPTTKEQGYSRVLMDAYYGIIGPQGLSPAVQNRVRQAFANAINSDEVKAAMAKLGAAGQTSSSEEYKKVMMADYEKWKAVIEKGQIKVN